MHLRVRGAPRPPAPSMQARPGARTARGTDRRVSPGSTCVPLTVFLPERKRKQQENVRGAGEAPGGPTEARRTFLACTSNARLSAFAESLR